MSKWTHFHDMHSGGGAKEKWGHIFIEAPIEEARVVFFNRFGHSPDRVTCTCCGEDYSVDEAESLEQATGYNRGCDWDKDLNQYAERRRSHSDYLSLEQYAAREGVLIIRASEIKQGETIGTVPKQGYVWQD